MERDDSSDVSVIFDLGANNGDDIPYYLYRADLVVAVEANPQLCAEIRQRFPDEIDSGSLKVENVVVTVSGSSDKQKSVEFYINTKNHVLSQFARPRSNRGYYERHVLPSVDVVALIRKYVGANSPRYCKIDLEHFDPQIVRHLFRNRIYPSYISAEAHSLNVLYYMITKGGYNAFKLVKGNQVAEDYRDFEIKDSGNSFSYSFPRHSAGPFGEDVHGDWMSSFGILKELHDVGLGWIDIHATRKDDPEFAVAPFFRFRSAYFRLWFDLVPRTKFWRARKRIGRFVARMATRAGQSKG